MEKAEALAATSDEIGICYELARCTFGAGTWDKKFVHDLSARNSARFAKGVDHREPLLLSLAQREQLHRLAHAYRKQLGKCLRPDCMECSYWPALWKKYCRPQGLTRKEPVAAIDSPKKTGSCWRYTCAACGAWISGGTKQRKPAEYKAWRLRHNDECSRRAVEAVLRMEWGRASFTDREREIEAQLIEQAQKDPLRVGAVLNDFYLEHNMIEAPLELASASGPLFAMVQQ